MGKAKLMPICFCVIKIAALVLLLLFVLEAIKGA
jgi:hypothetical protein